MRISSITLKNFRCFGNEPTTIPLRDISGLIGNNGAGKTAVLVALSRVFGISQGERRILTEDFHVPSDSRLDELDLIELFIELRIEFPELQSADGNDLSVPQCFNHMVISDPDQPPYCRIRLEASWTRSNLPEGDVDETTFWITTTNDVITDDDKSPMPAYARSMVHVLYVPAFRDTAKQLSQVSGSLVYRLFRAIEWSDATKAAVKDSSSAIRKSVHEEESVKHIHSCLAESWSALHDQATFQNVVFQPVGSTFDQILRQVEAVFSPGHDGLEHPIDRLSDGLKSLFYFALVSSVFQVEEHVKEQQSAGLQAEVTEGAEQEEVEEEEQPVHLPFSYDQLKPPALTVFAVEEPENHLAPHYLGRILALFKKIAESHSGQVILTSHSPSILARLDPEDITYLRVDLENQTSSARPILLPAKEDEAFKFVKEAVRAYPELYFSKLVILGEGDSEEIVIPRLATASSIHLDRSFASVVPLGGRHVNHFWRLLHGLDIPHITLLDLDQERVGGGWARIRYAVQQLLAVGVPRTELLGVDDGAGGIRTLSDDEVKAMDGWDLTNRDDLNGWLTMLEGKGIFFCSPLDLDFTMLRAFPVPYHDSGGGMPRIPTRPSSAYDARISAACVATLKGAQSTGATYSTDEKRAFIWYSYLFLGKSKPTTHILALSDLTDEQLLTSMPDVLKRLMDNIKLKLPNAAAL